MSAANDRLFTSAFFVMCGFTFTVFLSAFQLLPTAPFHILDLGGTTFASGLFLGFLTYSSAFSAPLTGAIADRVGQRRVLLIVEPRARGLLDRVRGHPELPVLLALVLDPRRVLVGAAVGVRGLHDEHAPRAAARRGHRLLGSVERRRDGGRADGRLLDLSTRLGVALRRIGRAEPDHGGDCVAPAGRAHGDHGGAVERARPPPVALYWSGASSLSRSRCSCTRSATAASRASPRSTPTRTA